MTAALDVRSQTTGSPRRWSQRATTLVTTAGHVVREVALTTLAIVGVVAAGITLFAVQNGMTPLVVRSGSMEPAIATGSMIVVEEVRADEIAVGDVVAVRRPDGTTVTHRVVASELAGGVAALTLKGDANDDVDPLPVSVATARRVVHNVPAIGRAMAWLASAPGGFAIGSLVTAVLSSALRRRDGGRARATG